MTLYRIVVDIAHACILIFVQAMLSENILTSKYSRFTVLG